MTKARFIKQARKPNPAVSQEDIDRAKAGEAGAASYWTWSFFRGGTFYSKTRPRPSQLTQSAFYAQYYGMQEMIDDARPETTEDLAVLIDTLAETANEIADECREKFDNMPEGLQQGDTGALLEERAEAMEEWASALANIDYEYDEEDDISLQGHIEAIMEEIRECDPNT